MPYSPYGVLDLAASRPGLTAFSAPPVGRLDGRPVELRWGHTQLTLPAGPHRLEVWNIGPYGPTGLASTTLQLTPGVTTGLYYLAPYGGATGVLGPNPYAGAATRVRTAAAVTVLGVLLVGVVVVVVTVLLLR